MSTQLRSLVGGTALVAGLWFLSGAAAAPPLAKDTYKKAAEADIAQLQKHLATCDNDPKDAKRYGPTAKSMAMVLAMYGEATGDSALKDQALKVADAIAAKDYKGALATAKGLASKPGAAPLAGGNLVQLNKVALDEIMSPFRAAKVGGLDIEKDIRSIRDKKMAIKPADVEVLAARTAILLDYATSLPNDKAKANQTNMADWVQLSKDSIGFAKKLSDEAAKGKGASETEIIKLIKSLDAKCVVCHNKFRDD